MSRIARWGPIRVSAVLALVLVACGPRFPDTQAVGVPGQDGALPTAAPPEQPTTGPLPDNPVAPTLDPGQGGSGGGGGGGPTTAPKPLPGGDVSVKGGTIKVGGLFPLSGGLSSLGKPAFEGAQGYFNYLNSKGGIRGKKIQFITCDDQADDTRTTTCAKRLVEQDDVFIMGPSFTPFSLTVIGQLEKQGVPWVGYDGINVEGFSASNVVTVGAPIDTMAHVLLPYWYDKITQTTGSSPKKIGTVVLDSAPALTYVNEAKERICPKLGCSLTRIQRVTYTTTDYATICRSMQNERVDAVWIVTDPASAIKLLVQCQNIGYKPPKGFLGQHGIYMDLTLEQSGPFADGIYANGAVLPESVDNAATREMKSIIRQSYPDASFGYFTQLAYASARMVADVIDEVLKSGKELNRANVMAAAAGMTKYGCHGLCKDVNLKSPPAQTGGNHNVWIVRAENGRWVHEAGPIDAFRSRTWPCSGRPKPC